MNFKITLFFVALLCNILHTHAKVKSYLDFQNYKSAQLDTIRDEFNLKKKSTIKLVIGKSADSMIKFYEYYLEENDIKRADSIVSNLLKVSDDVAYRYKISLISYRFTSDAKTQRLFMSDMDRVKKYRTYFLKLGVSSLKSNKDLRAHYLDLVALDSVYFKIAPDSLVQRQMGRHYNSLAWYSIITQKLHQVNYYLDQSIKYDPESKYPLSNLPLLLLLKGNYKEAEALYQKLKDLPFEEPNTIFKDEFLEDLRLLEIEGIEIKNVDKIKKLLKSKD